MDWTTLFLLIITNTVLFFQDWLCLWVCPLKQEMYFLLVICRNRSEFL